MQSESRPYFLLKFGKPHDGKHRLEVRNDIFELIGSCNCTDHPALARLLALPQLPKPIVKQVQALPEGKIIRITV
jgi:hypothetical protein